MEIPRSAIRDIVSAKLVVVRTPPDTEHVSKFIARQKGHIPPGAIAEMAREPFRTFGLWTGTRDVSRWFGGKQI